MKFELSHEFLPNQVDGNKSSHSASTPVNNNIHQDAFVPHIYFCVMLLALQYRVFLGQLKI